MSQKEQNRNGRRTLLMLLLFGQLWRVCDFAVHSALKVFKESAEAITIKWKGRIRGKTRFGFLHITHILPIFAFEAEFLA